MWPWGRGDCDPRPRYNDTDKVKHHKFDKFSQHGESTFVTAYQGAMANAIASPHREDEILKPNPCFVLEESQKDLRTSNRKVLSQTLLQV